MNMKLFKQLSASAILGKAIMAFLFIASLCPVFFLSCKQASIFYNIAIEPTERDARIPGSTTNIIHINDALYVGSRNGQIIYRNTGYVWLGITGPGGRLIDLATDGTLLYALVYAGDIVTGSTIIKEYDPASKKWGRSFSYPGYSLQSIYGAGGEIFAGAKQTGGNCLVLHLDKGASVLKNVPDSGSAMLTGAAQITSSGDIYLATGSGVYSFNSGTAALTHITGNMLGIIATGSSIVAISSDLASYGTLHVSDGTNYLHRIPAATIFSGTMCVWKQRNSGVWEPSLLLLGVREPENNRGYREMPLNAAGDVTPYIKFPGAVDIAYPRSSVTDRAKYNASIGTKAVEAILQAPETFPLSGSHLPIFAGTSKDGLWAYRNGEWNAEL